MAKSTSRKPNSSNFALDINDSVAHYQHDGEHRKNIPPSGAGARSNVVREQKRKYFYDPHRPPELKFDANANEDEIIESINRLITKAQQQPLTSQEALQLAQALQVRQPWLEWADKREKPWFMVEPVALHIHERLSAQAILRAVQRQPAQGDLFASPRLTPSQSYRYYEHDVDWSNRMILGDSLAVMSSLAIREEMKGKVQMIYLDPPYGIKYRSNFQPLINDNTVKDKESDLTRQPEQVKAYRDTWQLGVHSYLSYLRDRFLIARDLLTESGSIFVQISDENVHRVRAVMDEVFGAENFVSLITTKKSGGMSQEIINNISDYVIWYAKVIEQVKNRQLFVEKSLSESSGARYNQVEETNGQVRPVKFEESINPSLLPPNARVFLGGPLTSQTPSASTAYEFEFNGKLFHPKNRGWSTNSEGMKKLIQNERIIQTKDFVNFKIYFDDFPVVNLSNLWTDTMGTAEQDKKYVVQTTTKVIQRCMLMTTDPGDLVLDPTCGGGTTAYVAEQWGRRWITIDTSRVAIALARQRLLTAAFDYYKVNEEPHQNGALHANPGTGFQYEKVKHITLKSIAQNDALDPIFAKHEPILAGRLQALNATLADVTPEIRKKLTAKLAQKQKDEGKNAITDADRRRWELPQTEWKEWEVPFDTDEIWPESLQRALNDYRAAWRTKMDEVNACIEEYAEYETLVDKPAKNPRLVRVSGPFTVESVIPEEQSGDVLRDDLPQTEDLLGTFDQDEQRKSVANAESFVATAISLMGGKGGGVTFMDNKSRKFDRLEQAAPNPNFIHAEGEWRTGENSEPRRVGVSIGPQYGAMTQNQIDRALRNAFRQNYDDMVFAAFDFDAAAQAAIQEFGNEEITVHLAHIRPDVAIDFNRGEGDKLLKDTPGSQLFSVFGLPEYTLIQDLQPDIETGKRTYKITMSGVQIYDPVGNCVVPTTIDKVAAWFLDTDYDGKTFCVSQAFFPNKKAWEKIAKSLKGTIDEEKFSQLSGTVSLPFVTGEQKRAAIKVIDPRGNEVMAIVDLPD